ncbi:uncharacterized protein LAESUDRAFT_146667 [Laetiporus sulphureus 93-53]|uniref:Uncharacterized protein n=1 Tax=Laetiporus sulphureus 93-53 TaxID=1314785 RepID=A0A165EB93_9APHY|nr:uncharacterized protein LAESUDRAFT_146667 [Laetiporus sulphureus 93-53]KZT06647.1 hypothetical protein LAESUDRAFT_146667 [Laetiporus sulphureus 93-53]
MPSSSMPAISPETWKRVPTTAAAIFSITMPYRPPKNPVGAFFWRKRMLFETTMGLALLERWEKILLSEYSSDPSLCMWQCDLLMRRGVVIILYSMLILVVTGLYKYAPQYAVFVKQRTAYYIYGNEPEENVGRVADWVVRNLTGEL